MRNKRLTAAQQMVADDLVRKFGMDAEDAILGEEALRQLRGRVYDVPLPPKVARQVIPVDSSLGNGEESFKVTFFTRRGAAKLITDMSDDIPRVDLAQESYLAEVKSLAIGFGTNIQEVRTAAARGVAISTKKGEAAKDGMEDLIEKLAKYGDSKAGLLGLFNQPNTTMYTIPTNSGGDQSWLTKTPNEVLKDLHAISRAGYRATKQTEIPDTMLMDLDLADHLSTTYLDSGDTIQEAFLKGNRFIKEIIAWDDLDGAGVGGTSRIICYRRDPRVLELVIPQEFEMFPPQPRNFEMITNCHARCGGVVVYFPFGVVYADMDKAN